MKHLYTVNTNSIICHSLSLQLERLGIELKENVNVEEKHTSTPMYDVTNSWFGATKVVLVEGVGKHTIRVQQLETDYPTAKSFVSSVM